MDYLDCECCNTRIHYESAFGAVRYLDGYTTFLNTNTGRLYTAENESICVPCGDKHSKQLRRPNFSRWFSSRIAAKWGYTLPCGVR